MLVPGRGQVFDVGTRPCFTSRSLFFRTARIDPDPQPLTPNPEPKPPTLTHGLAHHHVLRHFWRGQIDCRNLFVGLQNTAES